MGNALDVGRAGRSQALGEKERLLHKPQEEKWFVVVFFAGLWLIPFLVSRAAKAHHSIHTCTYTPNPPPRR